MDGLDVTTAKHDVSGKRIKAARAGIVARFRAPVLWKSLWQIANTFVPFVAIIALMYASLPYGYGYTLALSVVAAGLLVRIFIIQHDCGHGAFFRSRSANEWLGRLCGVLTLTPFDYWRRQHNGHHTRWNCLDNRGMEVDPFSKCLTIDEYRALTPRQRWVYRLKRHPVPMFLLLPPFLFLVMYRIPIAPPRDRRMARYSVHLTTLAIVAILTGLSFATDPLSVLMVHLPVNVLGAIFGAWLFFVQHQFEGTSWVRKRDWRFGDAVGTGSSFLNLPPVLRWFSGNIGYHHIHHLDYRIPNYHLAACHAEYRLAHAAQEISLWSGLAATRLALWDESRNILVRFDQVPARPA